MQSECARTVQSQFEILFNDGSLAALTDAQLLDRFIAHREQAAFEALVIRHGGIVLRVCRAYLDNRQDAEDAMQATFLVLARKAASLRHPQLLSCWLYRVATHVARKARSRVLLRRRRETQEAGAPLDRVTTLGRQEGSLISGEEAAILHEEIARLPEHYRIPVVLHYLDGRPHDEIAQRLGRPSGTVSARISRARHLLRSRLVRRGVAPGSVLICLGVSDTASASLCGTLLRSTARAACRFAAGIDPLSPSALAANIVLQQMFWTQFLKLAACAAILLVTAAGLFAQRASAARDDTPGQPPTLAAPPADRSKFPAVAASTIASESAIGGRVLDPDGKPFPNANVAIVTSLNFPMGSPFFRTVIPTKTITDAEGRFVLSPPRQNPGERVRRYVHATAPGFGFARTVLQPGVAKAEGLELKLQAEQTIPIRLIDLEGKPVAGVPVRVVHLLDAPPAPITARQRYPEPPLDGSTIWPGPFMTDNDGHTTLRGLGRNMTAFVEVADDRFAQERFTVSTGDAPQTTALTLAVAPGRKLAGRVIDSETSRPIAGVTVILQASQESNGVREVRSASDGSFSLTLPPRDRHFLIASPPIESGYLPSQTTLLAARDLGRTLDVKLSRGVIVRGRVIEAEAKKPVDGVAIMYLQQQVNNPNFRPDLRAIGTGLGNALTGADGKFSLIVPPGPGTILAKASSTDYISLETTTSLLTKGENSGVRIYPHAIAGLNPKPPAPPEANAQPQAGDVKVEQAELMLHRGSTLEARAIDTNGVPVADAMLVSPTLLKSLSSNVQLVETIRDGIIKIPGQDPNQSVTFYVLDREHALGARAELRVKTSGKTPVIHLEPCGSARVRFLNQQGEPVADRPLFADGVLMTLELILAPGVPLAPPSNKLCALSCYSVNLDRPRHKALRTDKEGRVTFPALIPGATYRAMASEGMSSSYVDFTVSSGQTTEVGDLVMKARGQK
ncbi:sigma-70 family RNA polymerase sigma factor [Singulisphaera sp. PoT]|uniref:sigma-70 family RNA polymerase sigma factor n=1 Tax=Singulisphaera sp. PoT TaxID=3411797 RepID=UPI003BF4D23E